MPDVLVLVLIILAVVVLRVLFPSNLNRKMILEGSARFRRKTFCFDAYSVFADARKSIVMQEDAVEHQRASPAVRSARSKAWQSGVDP